MSPVLLVTKACYKSDLTTLYIQVVILTFQLVLCRITGSLYGDNLKFLICSLPLLPFLFVHQNAYNKIISTVKSSMRGLSKNICTFLMKRMTTFHCFHKDRTEDQSKKWCFYAKKTRLHFNYGVIYGDITVYISHFKIYLK